MGLEYGIFPANWFIQKFREGLSELLNDLDVRRYIALD